MNDEKNEELYDYNGYAEEIEPCPVCGSRVWRGFPLTDADESPNENVLALAICPHIDCDFCAFQVNPEFSSGCEMRFLTVLAADIEKTLKVIMHAMKNSVAEEK